MGYMNETLPGDDEPHVGALQKLYLMNLQSGISTRTHSSK